MNSNKVLSHAFEILAHDYISNLIRPAAYQLALLGIEYTGRGMWTLQWTDEIYYTLALIIDGVSLSKLNSTILENFYGLERSVERGDRLFTRSIIHVILIKYLQSKIEKWHSEVRTENLLNGEIRKIRIKIARQMNQLDSDSFKSKIFTWHLKAQLIKYNLVARFYPNVKQTFKYLELLYKILYTIDKIPYWEPILHAFGIKYYQSSYKRTKLESLAQNAMYIIIIALRFGEWWKNYGSRMVKRESTRVPWPKECSEVDEFEICGICHSNIKNPCLLAQTGYVYCFKCISEHLKTKKFCPNSKICLESFDFYQDLIQLKG